ncbi:EpsG family protein [Gracilibacillus orientalis]|uniref:EpsG family protein n=1 Tax=Gracilibacillus orientalis TaxID=334253 RepID=A0A1I4PDW5_9BACI|nr:EpsG family protein [Gracilibacillus orientalis]
MYSKVYLISSFIILFIISSIRAESVGTDTDNYLRGFKVIKNTSWNRMFEAERWEFGYIFLNKLSAYISNNDQIILFVTSFVFLFGIGYFIYKNSNNVVFSLYLFVSLFLYFFSFNGIRQAIAMSIIASGFHLIRERKLKKYLVIVCIASLFHITAILMIGIYFIYSIKLTKKNIIFILVTFVIFYSLLGSIINFVLTNIDSLNYLSNDVSFEGSGFLFPLITISVLLLLFIIRITEGNTKYLEYMTILVLLSFLISIISMKVSLILRLNYYLLIYYIIAIPYALNLVRDRTLRFLLTYITIVITLAYLVIRMIEGWHGINPYLMF